MEFISVYGLFLAKVATVVLAIAALAILAVSLGQRKSRQKGELQLTDLGEQYREMQRDMRLAANGCRRAEGLAETVQEADQI
ncbi:Probable protease sohB [Serratia marcescens]|uniref:Probable protease sohB n=1 Tax=Serratia marcescens TaxID=615 RepID=A0A379ZGW8_SERMA|nr:Probable protease sohB [Serratia marcescens]